MCDANIVSPPSKNLIVTFNDNKTLLIYLTLDLIKKCPPLNNTLVHHLFIFN